MGRLTHAFTADDIRFPVLVALNTDEIVTRIQAGIPVPAAALVTAILDTGTNITIISPSHVTRLGLTRFERRDTATASGKVEIDLYRVNIGLPSMFGLTESVTLADDLLVGALPELEPGVEVRFGLDLLLSCRLPIDDPARTFILDV